MKVGDLITWLESWANPVWQESWDNCGWQVEPGILNQAAHILVCLTPTMAVMQEAIALWNQGTPVNLIIAHHPLIFHPLKSMQSGDAIAQQIQLAYNYQIGIYTAHTNFDQAANGTADVLAQVLDLKQVQPIVPTQGDLGYGRVGDLNPSLALAALLEQIQQVLAPPDLLYSPMADLTQPMQRLAVLGGSGASFIPAVAQTGAQAYLTADCKFHQFQEARDRGLVLIDAGHYATERPACQRLAELIQSQGVDWVMLSQQDEDFRQFYNKHV